MGVVYRLKKYYTCGLTDSACLQSNLNNDKEPPYCENCDIYEEWKQSKKTMKEYSEDCYR